MAVKVRCSDCLKIIMVDQAFAGSMCRCPYCKAIVAVPAEGDISGSATASSRSSSRPGKPGESRGGFFQKLGFGKRGPRRSDLEKAGGAAPIVGDDDVPVPRFGSGLGRVGGHSGKASPTRYDKAVGSGTAFFSGSQDLPPVVGGSGLHSGSLGPRDNFPTDEKKSQEDIPEGLVGSGVSHQMGESGKKMARTIHIDSSKLSEDQLAAIPTANPVLRGSKISPLLFVIMMVVVAACVYFGIVMLTGNKETKKEKQIDAPVIVDDAPLHSVPDESKE